MNGNTARVHDGRYKQNENDRQMKDSHPRRCYDHRVYVAFICCSNTKRLVKESLNYKYHCKAA